MRYSCPWLSADIGEPCKDLTGDRIVVVASVDIMFADWNVEVPSSPAVVSVDDFGILEM